MSTDMTWRTVSTSSERTEHIGQQIGARLRGGEMIELVSDLGGGKTTFVRGLARGAGSRDHVSSPTFTVSKVYQAGQRQLHHFDFYRLSEAGLVGEALVEALDDPQNVVVVEWGEIAKDVLPAHKFRLSIEQRPDGARELQCTYPRTLAYLLEGVT